MDRLEQEGFVSVDAEDDRGNWVTIEVFVGELKDAKERAEYLMKAWIDRGWDKNKIRITSSPFKMNKKWSND